MWKEPWAVRKVVRTVRKRRELPGRSLGQSEWVGPGCRVDRTLGC